MNRKVTLLLCLIFFATSLALITNIVNTATISLTPLKNMINASNRAILDTGSVEPTGDPIDNPWPPHTG